MRRFLPHRRLFQFSLRAVLALSTIACLWMGYRANRAHRQRLALNVIHESGGIAFYEFEVTDLWQSPIHPPPDYSRFEKWLGRDYFERVVEVRYPAVKRHEYGTFRLVREPNASEAARIASCLPDLPDLKRLELHSDSLVDADLKPLAALSGLESLALSGAKLGDGGAAHLARLRGLRSLSFQSASTIGEAYRRGQATANQLGSPVESAITDAGVEHLSSLEGLQQLALGGRTITDASLPSLARLRGLESLSLQGTSVTREGMNGLRRQLPRTWISY